MEITLKQLLEVSDLPGNNGIVHQGSLSRLLGKELPVKTAYHLGKLFNKVKSELKQYSEHRDSLIKKYGKEKDGQIMIAPEDKEAIEKFTKDNEELINVTVKLDYGPIDLAQLGDVKLSPIDMANLEWMFRKPEND